MCHILAFDSRPTDVKCNNVIALYEAFKRRGKKLINENLITLGALQTLGLETEALVSSVIEVMEYLRTQDVFHNCLSFFDSEGLLYASALIIDEYTKGEELTIVQHMMLLAGICCADRIDGC